MDKATTDARVLESEHDFSVQTASGIAVASSYGPSDLDENANDNLAGPGEAPFGRGISKEMYRGGLWVMGQYSGYASPRETNQRIRTLLEQGQAGFSVALDLPTQNGLDSDDALSLGEVGKVGVPLDSLRDVEDLLDGIDLSLVRQVRTTANSVGPIVAAMFIAAIENLGGTPGDLRIMFQNDVLKEYVARGTQIFPPARGLSFAVDLIEYAANHLPHWEPIEFCGYHIRDSGANAIQEVSIAIANGIEYIEATLDRGVDIDDFAPNIFMFLAADMDLFEEVAKFRAARRIWSDLMTNTFKAKKPESAALNIFVYTLGGSLTAQEPLNNIARVTLEALAAVLGGVQTLATSSYDEAIGLPTAEAAQVSLRSQQIIAHESGAARTADPLGGSYYVEWLTTQIEERIRLMIAEIAEQGGALSALEAGWISNVIEREAYQQQLDIESGVKARIGHNRFAVESEQPDSAAFQITSNAEDEQIVRVQEVRGSRDSGAVADRLKAVRTAASAGTNTMPAILDAVRAYATVGEITNVLKAEWGTYK